MSIRMSPKRSRNASLMTRYRLLAASVFPAVDSYRGSVMPSAALRARPPVKPCSAMPTSKDCRASDATGTERSAGGSVGTVRKGGRGRGAQEEHGPSERSSAHSALLPNSHQDTSQATLGVHLQ